MGKNPKTPKVSKILASIMGGQEAVKAAAAQIAAALGTPETVPDLLDAKAEELHEMASLIRACQSNVDSEEDAEAGEESAADAEEDGDKEEEDEEKVKAKAKK